MAQRQTIQPDNRRIRQTTALGRKREDGLSTAGPGGPGGVLALPRTRTSEQDPTGPPPQVQLTEAAGSIDLPLDVLQLDHAEFLEVDHVATVYFESGKNRGRQGSA